MTTIDLVCPRCRQRSLLPGICRLCAKRGNYVRVRAEHERLRPISEVSADDVPRLPVPCWPEVENALSGGFVRGTTTALYGPPGVGKSTLALHLADAMATMGPSGYLSSEQLSAQVKLTAVRIGVAESHVLVDHVSTVEEVERAFEVVAFRFLVVDSLQGCCQRGEEAEAATRLVQIARERECAMLLVLRVTKNDEYAGARDIEHEVDGMLCLSSGEAEKGLLLTVVDKYRYGPVGRIARLGRSESGRLWDITYGPF